MTTRQWMVICGFLFYGMMIAVFDCSSSTNIYVDNLAVLESAEGPYNPELDLSYPIKIGVHNPDIRGFSFNLEHPFWKMIPVIESSSNAIIIDSTKQIDEGNIYVSVLFNPDPAIESHFISITFAGTKRQFFDSIQFFYGYPPEPPIRYSPPIYPIRIKNIQYDLPDLPTINEPDVVVSFLIADYGLRLLIHADLSAIQIVGEMTLELVSINDIPMPYDLKTKIDSNGNGVLQLPFTNIANFYSYYEPTFGVFELKCAGTTIARSPSLYIGSPIWQDVNVDAPLIPISYAPNWEIMD